MNSLIFRRPLQTRDSAGRSRTVSYLNGRAGMIAAILLLTLGVARFAGAQGSNSTSISGTVLDPSGAVVKGATVKIVNPVSRYERSIVTDDSGHFEFTNVPFNPYHLSVAAPGFQDIDQDVAATTSVPIDLKLNLSIASGVTTVTVQGEAADLIEQTPTTHTDVDRGLFDKLPLESASSSVSSLITLATPGIAADSNGLFHGMGDHAENSFSVDGQPITDQQSKVFSNQIPLDSIESLEVVPGAPPAEFGDKTSVLIKVTTRSGEGETTPHGSLTAAYGTFGTSVGAFQLAYGGQKWGNFISAGGLDTSRFLDPPEFTVMHDKGNQENLFDRVDYQLSSGDSVHVNLGYTRSWFQNPNSFDQQLHLGLTNPLTGSPLGPTDQRSQIGTINVAPSWTRLIGSSAVFTFGGFLRQDRYNYYPSPDPLADLAPDLQGEAVGQARRLTNLGLRSEVSYLKGIHNLKVGVTFEHTLLTENDSIGIVDPAFIPSLSPSCLDAKGNPLPGTPCAVLAPFDLTRGGGLFSFQGHTDVKELALYIEDAITKGNWSFNLGLRGDLYNGITIYRQAEPRVGAAYNVKKTSTVLRVSYARILETPFNENLVLASNGCSSAVINDLTTATQGYPCLASPLTPGTRNEFHAGLEQAFGRHLVVDGEYIWKYTHRVYDFSILGATPITFPIEWDHSKIPGYAVRASVPNFHGLTGFVVFSSVAARFFQPQVSGIGATPVGQGGNGVFRIDHDEHFNETTHLEYQPWKRGPWIGFNWRYDSGLVAGPVPCAGGDCANGPNGTDSVIDVSGITPDQQSQAGLHCGSVFATPTLPISPTGLCPASEYGSTLVKIPAPGTENDDHNPPRIAPRNLFDLSVGEDNLFHGDRYKWSLRFTAVNLANKVALYNFLSTFSGTHYVTPRTFTAELGFHF